MSQSNDALAALRDIHLPEAVSFWPLAPGWWALLAVAGLALAALFFGLHRRRLSARRAALQMLDEASSRFRSDRDVRALAVALSGLLRRVALFRFPRRDVASLHGKMWLEFLADAARKVELPADVVFALERSLYAKPTDHADADCDAWISATGRWIRRMT